MIIKVNKMLMFAVLCFSSVLTNKDWNRTFGISVSYRFGDLKTNVKKAMRRIHNDDLLKKRIVTKYNSMFVIMVPV